MRKSKQGKTVYLEMGIWYNADTGEIHLTAPKTDWFHTTVNDKQDSKRQHSNLFGKLSRCLKEADAPHPDERANNS